MLDRGRCVGAVAALVAVAGWLVVCVSSDWYDTLRERALDTITSAFARRTAEAEPVVVDIDRRTLAAWGAPRISYDRLAGLLSAIAQHKPAAIGIDVLLEDRGGSSGDEGRPPVNNSGTADGIIEPLVAALRQSKVVLGLALDPEQVAAPTQLATTPILVRGRLPTLDIWQAPGIVAPPAALAGAAAGLGVLVFSAESDASIRRVPLLVGGGGRLLPGLAVEIARSAAEASTLVLTVDPLALQIGDKRVPLDTDGQLRLVPETEQQRAQRTISALDIATAGERLRGRAVLIGTSAPELGGLRPAHGSTLVPSVQLHAAAVAQLRSGEIPLRSAALTTWELAAAGALGLASIAAALALSPAIGAVAVASGAAGWLGSSVLAYAGARTLIDPIAGPATMALGFGAAALAMAAETWRRRAALERSLEQRLSPAVARRIARDPSLLKLAGEERVITALFTDVEGFTAMTERAAPDQLISVLDSYFEGVSQIIVEHGGMIDKFVGDAVHAFFNAPIDLADHVDKALTAAVRIAAFAQTFQERPDAVALGFGRTRIGIETGPAIVGDVGGGRKLDYTAHGNAVNAAARLEAANKELGTTICVGPVAAAMLPPGSVRQIGRINVRGRSEPQLVYEPWPASYSSEDRQIYEGLGSTPSGLTMLLARHPADPVLQRHRKQLQTGATASS